MRRAWLPGVDVMHCWWWQPALPSLPTLLLVWLDAIQPVAYSCRQAVSVESHTIICVLHGWGKSLLCV